MKKTKSKSLLIVFGLLSTMTFLGCSTIEKKSQQITELEEIISQYETKEKLVEANLAVMRGAR